MPEPDAPLPERDVPPGETAGVEVVCVGCGDAFGSGGRLQSAWLVVHEGRHVMLDFGATALSGLARCGVEPTSIGAVLISHYHGDHYGGIPFLLRYRLLQGIRSPLTLVGPPGLEERLERALDALFPPCGPGDIRRFATLMEIVEGVPLEVGGLTVRGYPADHRPETHPMSLRVEVGGRTIGYTGDTAWTPGVEAVGRDADLLITEAYEPDLVRQHMSIAELRERLPGLGCGRVVLTHSGRKVLADPPALPGCVMAHDGLRLTL